MSGIDTSEIRKAAKRLAGLTPKMKRELVREGARGFLNGKSKGGARHGIIALTPPASKGVTGTAAKKAGEAVIAADASRIFKQQSPAQLKEFEDQFGAEREESFSHKGAKAIGTVRARVLHSVQEMLAWHRKRRVKSTGRTLNVNRDVTTGLKKKDLAGLDLGLVTPQLFNAMLKILDARVGLLAAGWNAACVALKVKVDAWIKRHGTSYGSHTVSENGGKFRLVLSNDVEFAGNVKNYEQRVQKAVDYQANAMNRQADFLCKKAIKEARF